MIFDYAPPWFNWALHEVGTREEPENRGPAIRRYVSLAHCGAEGEPWCSIFANAALESSGIHGTRDASSQSFRNSPLFEKLGGPALGAITVFWRGHPHGWQGHVGFYRGELGNSIYTLGGNEADMVQIEALPRNGNSFGLVGFYWPKSYQLPPIKPIIMPAGTPAHLKVT